MGKFPPDAGSIFSSPGSVKKAMAPRPPKPTPNQHAKWDFSNKGGGRWVTINGHPVWIPNAQGGKAEANHTPHNIKPKPIIAPGHENA